MSLFRKTPPPAPEAPRRVPAFTPAPKSSIRLKVMRPEGFSDAPQIADHLLAGRTVVMNLEQMERESMRHLLDFISGVTYALDGSMKKIAGDATFIVTPHSVALSDAGEEGGAEEAPAAAEMPGRNPVAAMFSAADDDPE